MAQIKCLTPDDAIKYVRHLQRNATTPGVGRPPISSPFLGGYKIDFLKRVEDAQRKWVLPVTEVGWSRAWGANVNDEIVGEVTLTTSRLIETQLHRVILGMGIEPEFRGNGLGHRLLYEALSWAKSQRSLYWIDLGVFSHNAPARRLYSRFGFQETGRVVDCFRVGDISVDDIQMTLELSQWSPKT